MPILPRSRTASPGLARRPASPCHRLAPSQPLAALARSLSVRASASRGWSARTPRARPGRRSARPSPGASDMQFPSRFASAALAFALVAAASTPAGAQSAQTDLYIDVSTHTMPGMAALGTLGRFAGAMGGGSNSYGMARHPGMPGRYMDVALDNHAKPGAPASQAIPKDLRLGDKIDLLPPERKT